MLHGYGQLAAQFIEVFSALDDGTRLIVAPEALNRFYVVSVDAAPAADRPVGATWMTREDRDNEIADYVAYLDAVAREVLGRLRNSSPEPRIVVFGFSQGAATAVRWIASGSIPLTHLVLWGGFLPPEIDSEERARVLREFTPFLVIGSRDRYVSSERLSEEEARFQRVGVRHRLIRYEGGHGVALSALRDVAAAIRDA